MHNKKLMNENMNENTNKNIKNMVPDGNNSAFTTDISIFFLLTLTSISIVNKTHGPRKK